MAVEARPARDRDPVVAISGPDAGVRGVALVLHGDTDRWTSPTASLSFARRAQGVARDIHYVPHARGGPLVRTLPVRHGMSTSFLLAAGHGCGPRRPDAPALRRALSRPGSARHHRLTPADTR